MSQIKLTQLIIPIVLISIYTTLFFILKESRLTAKDIIDHAASIYSRYGYEIIFAGAFMEALVVINFFLPGVTVVVLGAVFSRTGDIDLTLAVLSATAGALLGFMIDYLIGYFGFGELIHRLGYGSFLKKAKEGIERSMIKSFGLGFIHPNLGSFLSLAAGTAEISFINFLTLASLSTFVWTSLWGLLVFAFGGIFLTILTKYTTLLVMLVLCVWLLLTLYEKRRQK